MVRISVSRGRTSVRCRRALVSCAGACGLAADSRRRSASYCDGAEPVSLGGTQARPRPSHPPALDYRISHRQSAAPPARCMSRVSSVSTWTDWLIVRGASSPRSRPSSSDRRGQSRRSRRFSAGKHLRRRRAAPDPAYRGVDPQWRNSAHAALPNCMAISRYWLRLRIRFSSARPAGSAASGKGKTEVIHAGDEKSSLPPARTHRRAGWPERADVVRKRLAQRRQWTGVELVPAALPRLAAQSAQRRHCPPAAAVGTANTIDCSTSAST